MIELNFGSMPNLEHIFECGQCFRWNSQPDGSYVGVANGEVVRASIRGGKIVLDGTDDIEFWANYFDASFDYEGVKSAFSKDEILKKCVAHCGGIRILQQDLFETIISFIISANNNIPRIKKIIEALCKLCGEICVNLNYYAFPTAEQIVAVGADKLATIGAGYRDKYIFNAAKAVLDGSINLAEIKKMPTDLARAELLKFPGVGPKVADCVLLFGLKRLDVFPTDVWVKRILDEAYNVPPTEIHQFAEEQFGEYRGLAQQYLFYYYRENGKKAV